jgi:hypothetical protein
MESNMGADQAASRIQRAFRGRQLRRNFEEAREEYHRILQAY